MKNEGLLLYDSSGWTNYKLPNKELGAKYFNDYNRLYSPKISAKTEPYLFEFKFFLVDWLLYKGLSAQFTNYSPTAVESK